VKFFVMNLKSFPPGRPKELTTDSKYLMEQWRRINEWAAHNFEGFDRSLCSEIWGTIESLLTEGRTVNMRLGAGEKRPKFGRASEAYAQEAVEHCDINLSRGVDAELTHLIPE
jgi:hypothetical protein